MTFNGSPDGTLLYDLVATPIDGGVCLEMILKSDMPADLQGKARFNLEFLPASYKNKSFQTDLNGDGTYDDFGVFPLHPQDDMVDTERPNLPSQAWYVKDWNEDRGDAQPVPFATGYGFTFAPEDDEAHITISSQTTAKMELFDGRNRAQNGWYVLSTLITAKKSGDLAAKWYITPDVEEGWVREPNVGFSQAGYSPMQEKFAVMELDKWDTDYAKEASLYRVNADGSKELVVKKALGEPYDWMRYKYCRFDFSEVQETGLYCIEYAGKFNEVFPIAKDVYDDIWQSCLSGFLAVQMDHIEVREGYRIWHGASHMDDATLPPAGVNGWFDGMGAGTIPQKLLDAGFTNDQHVDGLNKGGWFDAGDFDLQMSRNFQVLGDLIDTAEAWDNMEGYDTLAVEWNDATGGTVEMHRPDGIPDIVQQAIHGSKQMLAQYEVLGGVGGTMEVRSLRQYTHLGDPSSDTDGYIYDPNLEEHEIVERDGKVYSGVADDRYLLMSGGGGTFSVTNLLGNIGKNFAGTAYLAADYYPEYAVQVMNSALKIWNEEKGAVDLAIGDWNNLVQYTLATNKLEELGLEYDYSDTLNYAYFKGQVDRLADEAVVDPFTSSGWGSSARMSVLFIRHLMDEDYNAKVKAAVEAEANKQTLREDLPYGLEFTSGSGWGGSPNTYSGVRNISMMYGAYQDEEFSQKFKDNILRSVDYLLGRHPATNASWISGVGTKSALHPYNSNRAEESFIPGSILPGHITFSDYVESMDDFSFLWFEGESIINYQSSWLTVGIAASKLANDEAEAKPAATKDFESDLDLQLKTIETSSWFGTSTDGYLVDDGFNVFMYSTQFDRGFGDQHCAGIELVQNGRRVATNGDIHLLPTPEQWDATPAPVRGERVFDTENNTVTVPMTIPEETFEDGTPSNPAVNYQLIAEPIEGGFELTVKLDEPLPADLQGKAGFNMEFLPAVYIGKSFQADADGDGTYDSFGVFPLTPFDDMEEVERVRTNNQAWYVKDWNEDRGDYQALPFASGTKMTFASEDDDYRIRIESEDGLTLHDGRNRANNGWFVLRTLIPEGKTEITWKVYADTTDGWTREPNISHSQAGYTPEISKVAVIELDPGYVGSDKATLKRLNADGTYSEVFSAELGEATSWKRYAYRDFDFSEVTTPGMYVIEYDGVVTDVFPIKAAAYEDSWQMSLSNFLAIEMDHMKVREAYKIWHQAAHMDDGLQAPLDTPWFDYPGNGSSTKSDAYEVGEHIPNLAVGGWVDAGDLDIQVARNIEVLNDLAIAKNVFDIEWDTMDVDWTLNSTELHRPDGDNDVQQQIKHGVLSLLAQLDEVGYIVSCFELPSLRQYTHIGDASKDTDGKIYDPTLGEDEVDGLRSGKKDDRVIFTAKSARTNVSAAAALAASANALKGYDDELANKCIAAAEKIWTEDAGEGDFSLALELYVATKKDVYKKFIEDNFDAQVSMSGGGWFGPAFASNGWKACRVLDDLDDSYTEKYKAALAEYVPTIGNAANPYGVADSNGMWGGIDSVVRPGQTVAVLHKYFPDIMPADFVYTVANYVFGTHPYNSTSYLSGVGTKSVEKAYGINRADNYYIAGGIVPGYVTIAPDLPEHMDDFGFLWFENEYVINTASKWITVGYAADLFSKEARPECEHNWIDKVFAPTCNEPGYTEHFCDKCFEMKRDNETAALGHVHVPVVTDPSCLYIGYTTYSCSRCYDVYVKDETQPLGHTYVHNACIRCGRIDPAAEGATFKLAETVEAGKQYVIVFGDKALTNGEEAIGATAVTVEEDAITSAVTPDMIWDFTKGHSTQAGNYKEGFFLYNEQPKLLSLINNGGSWFRPNYKLGVSETTPETIGENGQSAYWVFSELDEGGMGMFALSVGWGTSYYIVGANEEGITLTTSNNPADAANSPVKLYELSADTYCPSDKFEDAPAAADWAHAGIDYCIAEGLMNGTSETLFSPANSLTRAQIATILYRIAGSPEVEYKAVFTDVADDIWYTDAIIWAAEEGIVKGYPEGNFLPNKAISREQIATILYRYSDEPAAEGDLAEYPDAGTVSVWAADAMNWAVTKGLINGIKSGEVTNLAPQKDATRAQFATIIMRYLAE